VDPGNRSARPVVPEKWLGERLKTAGARRGGGSRPSSGDGLDPPSISGPGAWMSPAARAEVRAAGLPPTGRAIPPRSRAGPPACGTAASSIFDGGLTFSAISPVGVVVPGVK